ncbi:hypothetical protein [Trinickia fusca]|uniref:hypothetical protein n=1 Tax=Trinickia fusca TaxID=2419777 RepID=UPI0011C37EF6|nr:hypothetical protein [Trinickia fusca]
MKPFITDACKDGRCTLPFQFEGVERERLEHMLVGNCIVAYALPDGHSLEGAWQCRFILADGGILEFSSACTVVDGWQEVGSLNIRCIRGEADLKGDIFKSILVGRFCIDAVECLIYEDPSVYSECGVILYDFLGRELIIAAGVSPGAVSIKAPFSDEHFSPEFPLDNYCRIAL